MPNQMNALLSTILAGAMTCLASIGICIVLAVIVASTPFEEPEE